MLLTVIGCSRPHPISPDARNSSNSGPVSQVHKTDDHAASGYVNDAVCGECHSAIADSYSRHSMGRSLATIPSAEAVERLESDGTSSFFADGFRYDVRREKDLMVHRQVRVEGGRPMAEVSLPVAFAVGSGKNGRSYLVNRAEYLFLSPITWYPQKGIWDLSPGYEKRNSQFHRPVPETCLFCHGNRALSVPDSMNRYEPPIFDGHAIGCQRCHGPGNRHVQRHREGAPVGTAEDHTIVNPGRLKPHLREAVCQQCHLSGAARVTRRGRSLDDFRPGQSLESTLTVFLSGLHDGHEKAEFVGQVEQMHASRCFQSSSGRLGCVSCHDPHQLPTQDERIDYYRRRCQTCHENGRSCNIPLDERTRQEANDCVACHMPRQETEIRHAATTDHRVIRVKQEPTNSKPKASSPPLVRFSFFGGDSVDHSRELAIAITRTFEDYPTSIRLHQIRKAREILERHRRQFPADIEALEALAIARLEAGDRAGALTALQEIVREHPRREFSVVMMADLLSAIGTDAQAAGAWQRAVELNPWMVRNWYSLGKSHARMRNWSQVLQIATKLTERFPTSVGGRHLLVESHLELGNLDQATKAFQQIEDFAPDELPQLQAWFAAHPLRRTNAKTK